MPRIELSTQIDAPPERVFDLSRSIDLHMASTSSTGERVVGGVASGLIGMDQEVTWRAKHFGIWQTLTSRITAYDRPRHFRDSLQRGAFKRFDHDHYFEATGRGTQMRDVFEFESPLGFLGRIADWIILERYMTSFLAHRNETIKSVAESPEGWKLFLK